MIRALLSLFILASSSAAFARPMCLDLTKAQAEKAVSLAKIALYQGSSLRFVSKGEPGLVKPMGIWVTPKKHRNGKSSYRVQVDGRDVDISLIYVARSEKDPRAFNLAWLAGCRPALGKPTSVSNR